MHGFFKNWPDLVPIDNIFGVLAGLAVIYLLFPALKGFGRPRKAFISRK